MNKVPASSFTHPIHFLAIGLGSGAAPKAPGTFGTAMAVLLYWPLSQLALWPYIGVVFVAAVLGVYICGKTSRDWQVHDHGGIVWDEFVGYWITMIAIPVTWYWALLGFVLFRIFDIWKPWPISWLDHKVHGGLGIMIDDVVAGVFAWVVLASVVNVVG
ncbi:phosphatidylglycerophosphatase A [Gammaproteobacteria bacterium 45_16_T64]|nr:phosphatidylglycerophosphatase A [Gammaproteobacteria bacterium 45_16_T64]